MIERVIPRFGRLVFDRDAIIRAALRAHIEVTLGFLDPQERHKFKPAAGMATWIGGVWSLALWGRVGRGQLLPPYDSDYATTVTEETFGQVAPILAVVDAVVDRRLRGPTELLPDEIAIVLPTPPRRPNDLPDAQRSLQKVGVTWPGLLESPE